MPMVRGGDGDGIHILALEQLSDVAEGLYGHAFVALLLLLLAQDGVVDVAQAGDAAALHLPESFQVALPAPAKADHGDADVVIGARDLGPGTRGPGHGCGGRQGAGFKKGAAGLLIHTWSRT